MYEVIDQRHGRPPAPDPHWTMPTWTCRG